MKHEFSIVCDEVRAETTGKLILVGVYPNNSLGVVLPVTLGIITFYQVLTSDRTGAFPFRAQLIRERDRKEIQAIEATMNITSTGPVIGMLSFRNVEFSEPGRYALDLVFSDERLKTAEFTIIDQRQPEQQPPDEALPQRMRKPKRTSVQ